MLEQFFGPTNFIPHGHCYLWSPPLVWLEVGSNLLIGVAYLVIGTVVTHLMRQLQDIPFRFVNFAIATLFFACGLTHFFDVLVVWAPYYWADASVRAVTAAASVATAALLPTIVPRVVDVIRGAQTAAEKGIRLESAVDDLENMYQKAKELEEKKTEFFANVSHELRTPLTLMLGESRRLLESDLSEADRESVETIADNSRVLLSHVEDLLDIANYEAGELSLEFSRFEIGELVGRMTGAFQGLADEYDIEFNREYPDELRVRADERKLGSILSNLLSNAFKFAPDGGTVVCRVTTEAGSAGEGEESVVLEVRDSGPGVPEEKRDRIFERFEQADDEKADRFGGTGLGLVVVRNYVHLHGGTVEVEDAPEGGASFVVRLPIRAGEDRDAETEEADVADRERDGSLTSSLPSEEEVTPETDEHGAPPSAARVAASRRTPTPGTLPPVGSNANGEQQLDSNGESEAIEPRPPTPARHQTVEERENGGISTSPLPEKPRILVAEDNPEMNAYICRLLEDEYRTLSVYDGEEALDKIRRHQIDVVLTDLMMPKTSGSELVRRLSDIEDLPILVVTAKADDRYRTDLLKKGANDFLPKPFSPEELRTRVSNLVSIQRTRRILQHQLATRRKSVEELARKVTAKQSELEQALETARLARRHAERASEMKSEFLGMVSHELRTPLAALQMQFDLMREQIDAPVDVRRELCERISGVLDRLMHLIENLLDQAAIESGQLQVSPKTFELVEVLREIVEEHRPQAESQGLELELDSDDTIEPVHTDERMVQLIVANLIRNGIEYTESGGVYVAVRQIEGDSIIRVHDTGPGIDVDEQSEIFSAFERGEQGSNMQVSGLGVGLSIVRDMARALAGSVRVESELAEGSTFIVSIPSTFRTRSDDDEEERLTFASDGASED